MPARVALACESSNNSLARVISLTASLTIRFKLETLKTATPSRLLAFCNWLRRHWMAVRMRGAFSGAINTISPSISISSPSTLSAIWPVGLRRDANDLGQAEVGGAEIFEFVDQVIRVFPGHEGVSLAELVPCEVDGLVGLRVSNLAQACCLCGHGLIGDHPERLSPADLCPEVHVLSDFFIHVSSSSRKTEHCSGRFCCKQDGYDLFADEFRNTVPFLG